MAYLVYYAQKAKHGLHAPRFETTSMASQLEAKCANKLAEFAKCPGSRDNIIHWTIYNWIIDLVKIPTYWYQQHDVSAVIFMNTNVWTN